MRQVSALVTLRRVAIERRIHVVRGHKVMLDSDLAALYHVETRTLVQAVRRNLSRFPLDFMFQITADEFQALRSQSVISNTRGGRRYRPYVFTEHGIAMLSSVLRSGRAIQANISIVRTFIRLREFLVSHERLAERLSALERRYDGQLLAVFEAIRELTRSERRHQRPIGFRSQPPNR